MSTFQLMLSYQYLLIEIKRMRLKKSVMTQQQKVFGTTLKEKLVGQHPSRLQY